MSDQCGSAMGTLMGHLPGGYSDAAGALHREVELLPLSGREEELLADRRRPGSAALVTQVISRCVRRIGTISPLSEAVARDLLVADRQYLLLILRQATFGDLVQATLTCPWPGCGARFDISFNLSDVPVVESVDKGPAYQTLLSPEALDGASEAQREVCFRLPTGADQEVLAALVAENEAAALTLLLARCVLAIGGQASHDGALTQHLTPRARQEIEQAMQAISPQVDLTMDLKCHECQRAFQVPFDLQSFFFGELRISRELLYREVHYLAYHYHWSEDEIMAFPREKRRAYIEVLADEIERLNNAVG